MSIEDCDKMINKLIDLQMLELERTRTRSPVPRRSASFEVKPQNAQAAQYALSHGESANVEVQQRVPSASPSSTIAASTPVFARATGSRNRIMAAKVEYPEIAPESSIPLPPQGPAALDASRMEEAHLDVMEGLSLQMGKASIAGTQEESQFQGDRPRRKRHFGLTVASKPSGLSIPSFKKAAMSFKSKGSKATKSKR